MRAKSIREAFKARGALALALAVLLVAALALCGCGGGEPEGPKSDEPAQEQTVEADDGANSSEPGSTAAKGDGAGKAPEVNGKADEPAMISVSVSVDPTASSRYTSSFYSGTVQLKEGSTVYDALAATGLTFSGSKSYIRGINGLSEKDEGGQSGWRYMVNGSFPGKACNQVVLGDGDSVVWKYSLTA